MLLQAIVSLLGSPSTMHNDQTSLFTSEALQIASSALALSSTSTSPQPIVSGSNTSTSSSIFLPNGGVSATPSVAVAPTITFSNFTAVYNDPVTFTPNITSNSPGLFTFTSSNPTVASVSGDEISTVSAGTTTITATQAATGNYLSGSATALMTVTAPLSVYITPATTTLFSGATTTFVATFVNFTDDGMWSAHVGTINPASGFYTAPTVYATTTDTVTVQSQTIAVVSSTATVTVVPLPITISISPSSPTMNLGGATQQFTATVANATNTAVTWSAIYGTINASGTYTSPVSASSSDTITATSVADPTKSASTTVNFYALEPPGA